MNVTVRSGDLARELAFLEKIVSKKPTLPVLANVMFQSHEGWLHMSATDLEIALVTSCPATIEADGVITLPAKKLLDLAKSLPDADITIVKDQRGSIRLTSGAFVSRLQTLPPEDFPQISAMEGDVTVLQRHVLRDLALRVQYAIPSKSARSLIEGALLRLPVNEIALVATDSHRLSVAGAERVGAEMPSIVIHRNTLEALTSLLTESVDGDLNYSCGERHLFFEIDGRLLVSRRMEGSFPAYQRVLPKKNEKIAQIERLGLITMLRRSVLISEAVTIAIENGAVAVAAISTDVGDALETLACEYVGERAEVSLNGKYALEWLETASGQHVTLALHDDKNPALFTDGNYVGVIMVRRK
jgi:DNA polymerase III subunit beta